MASSAQIAAQIAALDKSYNPTDTYNKLTTQLGIPDARTRVTNLRTQIQNTENAINNVDPSVTGRTQHALVTEAQRERLVNMEKEPLTTDYNKETTNYNTASTNENDLEKELAQEVSLAQQNYQSKRQSLATQLSAAQAAEAAAEAKREFDVQQAAKASSGGGSGGGGGGGSLSQRDITASVRQGLNSVKGGDNHVSPKSLAHAYNIWLNQGLSASSFWKNFQGYWNPKQSDYKAWFNKWVSQGV